MSSKFGIVSSDVLSDPSLSLQAKGLYAILCTYANKNRECYPSISTLADLTNKSVSQISVYIRELKTKNYVTRKNGLFVLR